MEETANDGTKWTFVSFGSEERRRRATRNSLTEQSGLCRRSRQISDSPSGAFQLLLDIHIIFLIRNCTNVEARKVLRNEDWSVSRFEMSISMALLYVQGAYERKNFSLDNFWNKQYGVIFFWRL